MRQHDPNVIPIDDQPLVLAEEFAAKLRAKLRSEERVLHYWREEWWHWTGVAYRQIDPTDLRRQAYRFLKGLHAEHPDRKHDYKLRPDNTLVNKLFDALQTVCFCEAEQMPSWVAAGDSPDEPTVFDVPPADDARDVVAFKNGYLRVGRYLGDGDAALDKPTPLWFGSNVLPYDFEPGAQCPLWTGFVEQCHTDDDGVDEERVSLLQEWFGYCLTADTSQQKMLLMPGAGGSGKGTTLDVLRHVVGEGNVATPRLRSLGHFGLDTLRGKTLAICADAHIGRDVDAADIVETLKAISGEDAVDIERKHKTTLAGVRLPLRFAIAVNEIPDLPDQSTALARRLLVIPYRRSFQASADTTLRDRLKRETPGILLWALEGLARLREQGGFTRSRASEQAVEDIKRMGSPGHGFVEDEIITRSTAADHDLQVADLVVPVKEVWNRWKRWASDNGNYPGTSAGLSKRLKAVVPGLDTVRIGPRTNRYRAFQGIALRPSDDQDETGRLL